MKFLYKLLLVLIIPVAPYPQDTAAVRQQAQLMADAFMTENYEVIIDHTYPKIVNSAGGKDKMAEVIKQGMGMMKEQGFKFESASVGSPGKFYKAGTEIHCLVPETIVLVSAKGRLTNHAYLLAVSKDGGKFWYFLDINRNTYDKVFQLFPNFNKNLIIPEPTQPVMQ